MHLASFNVLNYFPTTGAATVAAGRPVHLLRRPPGQPRHRPRLHDGHRQLRSAWCGRGRRPRPPAGQDRPGHQRPRRRRGLAGGDRELHPVRQGPRRRRTPPRRPRSTTPPAPAPGRSCRARPRPPTRAARTSSAPRSSTSRVRSGRSGESVIDDVPVFDVARDPLAQAFQPVGGGYLTRFVVVVNHFKSKGSGPDDGTGQGASNPQRIQQALELKSFAGEMRTHYDTDKVFLSGDFNAYTREDPMAELYRRRLHRHRQRRRRPRSTPTSSTARSARSTTCSATPPRPSGSPARTSGTSTRWSRWPSSTAGSTTT